MYYIEVAPPKIPAHMLYKSNIWLVNTAGFLVCRHVAYADLLAPLIKCDTTQKWWIKEWENCGRTHVGISIENCKNVIKATNEDTGNFAYC